MRDLEKAAGSVVGTLMKRLNYIGRRTAVAMVVIAVVAALLSAKKALSAELACNTMFIRFCPDKGKCLYFPDKGRFTISDGRKTVSGHLSTGAPIFGSLKNPELRPNNRWTIVSREVEFASQTGVLTISEDTKKSIPTHFSLTLDNVEEIGFCH